MLQGVYASTMWYFRSMDAIGIYVIATGIMILLCFTMTKNHVLLMRGGVLSVSRWKRCEIKDISVARESV